MTEDKQGAATPRPSTINGVIEAARVFVDAQEALNAVPPDAPCEFAARERWMDDCYGKLRGAVLADRKGTALKAPLSTADSEAS